MTNTEVSPTSHISKLSLSFVLNILNILLALTFVFSSIFGYCLTLVIETNINTWIISLVLAFVLSVIILYKSYQHGWLDEYMSGTIPNIISLLPFIVILPAFIIVFIYPSLQASFHSDLHSPIVDQIQFYTGQPRNIYFWSEPMSYYWLYHALIATLSYLMRIPDTQVWVIINIVTLISTFAWIHRCLPYVLKRRYHPILEAMLVVFILFSINLFGFLHSMVGLLDNNNPSLNQVLYLLSPKAFNDTIRLASLFLKYPNYNSFPLSIMYSWIGIYLALKILNNQFKPFDIILFCVSLAGGTLYLLIGGLFEVATLAFAMIGTWVANMIWMKDISISPIKSYLKIIVMPYLWLWGICVIFLLPVGYYGVISLDLLTQASSDVSIQFVIRNFDALLTFIGAFYPLTPFILAGIWISYRYQDRILTFLLFFALAHLILSYFFNFTHGNEYKFVLLAVFPFALITVRVLDNFTLLISEHNSNDGNKQQAIQIRLGVPIIILLYTLASINLIGVTAFFNWMGERSSQSFTIEKYTFASNTSPLSDAFTWIREETAQDTLLLSFSANTSSMTPRDTNRAMLIIEPVYAFAEGIPEIDLYFEQIEQLLQSDIDIDTATSILDTLLVLADGHPVAIIVKSDIALYEMDAIWINAGFTLRFDDGIVKVYYRNAD